MMPPGYKKFPSIEPYWRVAPLIRKVGGAAGIPYVATVKLHGTHAAFHSDLDGVTIFSRNNKREPGEHFGLTLADLPRPDLEGDEWCSSITVYGEWCGPGIQKGVAISKLPERRFFPFMERRDGIWMHFTGSGGVTPYGDVFLLFGDDRDVGMLNSFTIEVDAECPTAKMLGIVGPGEGLVWTPAQVDLLQDERLWFKTKGESHRGGPRERKPATLTPEQFESVNQAVERLVLDDRLEQAWERVAPTGLEDMGRLLGEFSRELEREEREAVEASIGDWRHFNRGASKKARDWFLERFKRGA